jgi:hypothetical protein
MFAGDPAKHPRAAKKAILAFSAAALAAVSAAAPQTDRHSEPADSATSPTRPAGDTEIIVKPPAGVDPGMAKPAPRNKDPELVEPPPADAMPDGSRSRAAPSARSRPHDCKGATADCRQDRAR